VGAGVSVCIAPTLEMVTLDSGIVRTIGSGDITGISEMRGAVSVRGIVDAVVIVDAAIDERDTARILALLFLANKEYPTMPPNIDILARAIIIIVCKSIHFASGASFVRGVVVAG
jgi:hypothetical protein